jgi:hypothetical protein
MFYYIDVHLLAHYIQCSLIVCFNPVDRKSLEYGKGRSGSVNVSGTSSVSCTNECHSRLHELRYREMTQYGSFI